MCIYIAPNKDQISSLFQNKKEKPKKEKMVMKLSIAAAISLLLLLAQGVVTQAGIFNIKQYGAQAGGNADISQALLRVWKEACAAATPTKIVIPGGIYLLSEISMDGPCKAPVEIQLQGTFKAPADYRKFKTIGWLTFNHVDHLTISGGGIFDGQGASAWTQNQCGKSLKCQTHPTNIRFNFITNSIVRDITSLDSKNFHFNVLGCKNFTFQHVTITAPETSANTDGIHIGRSSGINITNTNIKTGDDCVSIGDGSQQINVERVTCGPGHGISVGSLGRYPNEEPVVGITIRNCTLTKTMNGIRVKTWPASPSPSIASDMHFEDIIMDHVGNPILIDQEYCPWNQCTLKFPSLVEISRVSFKRIRGTSATQIAVKLVCSKSKPCQNVEVGDIDLTYSGVEGPATTHCANIQPTFSGRQNPPKCVSA